MSVFDFVNKPLILCITVPLVGGIASGLITETSVRSWYKTIKKPSWTPPNWIFPLAWTGLYVTMGTASYLVYQTGLSNPNIDTKWALMLYGAQLAFNFAWTPLFFGWHCLAAAAYDSVALLGTLLWTTKEFYTIHPTAGLLMLPYCGWVSYAVCLSWWIWKHNPSKKKGE